MLTHSVHVLLRIQSEKSFPLQSRDTISLSLSRFLSAKGESIRVLIARDLRGLGAPLDCLQQPHYAAYPAHMHIDLLPVAQGSGIGRYVCFLRFLP
jgi:hypothetical protein